MGIKKKSFPKNKILLLWVFFLLGFSSGMLHADYATDYLPENMEEKKEYSGVYLFQKSQGNYLVFYNGNGDLLYIRYRRDQFDYINDRFREICIQGIPFRVTYIFTAHEEEELTIIHGIRVQTDNSREIRKRRKIIHGSLLKVDYYIDDMIRY